MTPLMIDSVARVRLKRFAAAFAAAAQFFIAAAPLEEARLGKDQRAHVEGAGTSIHHAHNEADCAACVSQHILSTAEPGRTAPFTAVASAHYTVYSSLRADSRAQWSFARSRAPPTVLV
jgi:hypothetical protein